jgi:serine/threonine protein kinase
MLVMSERDTNLRNYLQQNQNQLTWKGRIQIAYSIIANIFYVHKENAIHRDLHSGNILYSQLNQRFEVSDLGFCGPADKSSTSIYGNLPYIAPEVISRKEYTFKSDIYSIAMLMWEISSGQPPFNTNYEHDLDFVMNIVNGMRPKVVPGTPPEYKSLMEQCWDADPSKRPDIQKLWEKMREINFHYQRIEPSEITQPKVDNDLSSNYTSSRLHTSKVHQFKNMPEPRNATKGTTI